MYPYFSVSQIAQRNHLNPEETEKLIFVAKGLKGNELFALKDIRDLKTLLRNPSGNVNL